MDVAISLKNLGTVLVARGESLEARSYFRAALDVFSAALPPSHWRTGEALSLLGASLGDSPEAEEPLTRGFEALRQSLGMQHRRTREALARLRSYYVATDQEHKLSRYNQLLDS